MLLLSIIAPLRTIPSVWPVLLVTSAALVTSIAAAIVFGQGSQVATTSPTLDRQSGGYCCYKKQASACCCGSHTRSRDVVPSGATGPGDHAEAREAGEGIQPCPAKKASVTAGPTICDHAGQAWQSRPIAANDRPRRWMHQQ